MSLVPCKRTAPSIFHRRMQAHVEGTSADPGPASVPSLDLEEREDELRVTIELPGVEPGDVDPQRVDAWQRNGVLTVTMKKSGGAELRRATVRGS